MPGPANQAQANSQQGTDLNRHMKQLAHGLLLMLLLVHSSLGRAEDSKIDEYSIKAAFLYNFSSFVSWPDQAIRQNDEFQLCVLGNDPFGEALDTLSGKPVHGLLLKVRRLGDRESSDACQLIYIGKSEGEHYATLLGQLQEKPVLTVSGIDKFTDHGGIIRFKIVNNRVRFDINVDAAERAGLKLSSKLLSLATIVRDEKVTAR